MSSLSQFPSILIIFVCFLSILDLCRTKRRQVLSQQLCNLFLSFTQGCHIISKCYIPYPSFSHTSFSIIIFLNCLFEVAVGEEWGQAACLSNLISSLWMPIELLRSPIYSVISSSILILTMSNGTRRRQKKFKKEVNTAKKQKQLETVTVYEVIQSCRYSTLCKSAGRRNIYIWS